MDSQVRRFKNLSRMAKAEAILKGGKFKPPVNTPRKATEEYNLECLYPKLAKEWHPKLNGVLTPRDVTPGSNKKVWWRCVNGHEWQTRISKRKAGTSCPYCRKEKKSGSLQMAEEEKPQDKREEEKVEVRVMEYKKLTVRVSPDVHTKLKAHAAAQRKTVNKVVCEAMDRLLSGYVELSPEDPVARMQAEEREFLEEIMAEEGGDGERDLVSIEEVKMLLKGGHNYGEIAELMGVSLEAVRQAVRVERKRRKMSKQKKYVEKELKNLDVLQKAIWEKASKGNNQGVELMSKIMELRARLMGVE